MPQPPERQRMSKSNRIALIAAVILVLVGILRLFFESESGGDPHASVSYRTSAVAGALAAEVREV